MERIAARRIAAAHVMEDMAWRNGADESFVDSLMCRDMAPRARQIGLSVATRVTKARPRPAPVGCSLRQAFEDENVQRSGDGRRAAGSTDPHAVKDNKMAA